MQQCIEYLSIYLIFSKTKAGYLAKHAMHTTHIILLNMQKLLGQFALVNTLHKIIFAKNFTLPKCPEVIFKENNV